jgi:hypothetical protein
VQFKATLIYQLMSGIVTITITGGLGNQLFQIAAAYAYAKRHGLELQILLYKTEYDGRSTYWYSILSRLQSYLVTTLPDGLSKWYEQAATVYSPIPECKSLHIGGYLQSSKYFKDYANEIKELYKLNEDQVYMLNSKYPQLVENKDRMVVVHARRTDYTKNDGMIQFHGPLTDDYYQRAIAAMVARISNPCFLLVADDPSYWTSMTSKIKELKDNPCYILSDETDINTFALLQQFHYYIIANSTFSWWAAWLADTKHVIAPKRWFGLSGPKEWEDIYEAEWERT